MKTNRFWLAVLGFVVIVSAIAMLAPKRASASRANIYQDGELVESLDLSSITEPRTLTVRSSLGSNAILAESGRVCVSDANCPDRLCVRRGWLSDSTLPIVCLPHRLVIRLETRDAPKVDAIVG